MTSKQTIKPGRRKLPERLASTTLLLLLAAIHTAAAQNQNQHRNQSQNQARIKQQHQLTRLYHELQQNELYKMPAASVAERQLIAPLLASGVAERSANNRGSSGWRQQHQAAASHFGQRRRRSDQDGGTGPGKQWGWSQADPRKSYSQPVAPAAASRAAAPPAGRQLAPAAQHGGQLKRSEQLDATGSSASASATSPSSILLDGELDNELLDQQHTQTSGPPRQAAGVAPLVTLIRYVPVVMELPMLASAAQQQRSGAKQQGALLASQLTSASTLAPPIQLMEQLYPYQAEPTASMGAKQASQATAGARYQLVEAQPVESLASAGQRLVAGADQLLLEQADAPRHFTRLAYVPVGAGQLAVPAGQAASRALSAYASRLIAMLRPSSLLSSISATAPAHHLMGRAPTQQQQQAHIYLLAPETASGGATAAAGHQSQAVQQKPVDTLLDQASKVHSTKSQQYQGQPAASWPALFGSQMNGLVCVQGLIGTKQTAPKQGAQRARLAKQQQQQAIAQQSQVNDEELEDSFDYERPQAKGGGGDRPQQAAGKGQQARARMESPVRMMQRVANKLASGDQKRAYEPTDEGRQLEAGQHFGQHRLLSSSSSDSSSLLDSRHERGQRARGDEPGGEPAHSNAIIPFTIRDKIEVPAARPQRQHQQQPRARVVPAPPEVTTRLPAQQTNGPVQYDEPAEPSGPEGYGEPLEQARRSRTTFVASGSARSAPQAEWAQISYNKELAGSLPVLMASSAAAAGRLQERAEFAGRTKPVGPAFASRHELLGSSSSASSVSTTTGASAAALEPATSSPPPPPPPPPARQTAGARGEERDTVELVVNSTSAQNITAGPQAELVARGAWESGHAFSHERTLVAPANETGGLFGRISESLQTNPLDLIDLQNSRSSFALPAQLESLSMLQLGRAEPEPAESGLSERRLPASRTVWRHRQQQQQQQQQRRHADHQLGP